MADSNQVTTPQDPAPTDTTAQPVLPATEPEKGGGAATGDDERIELSKEDYNNLIAARDRSNNTVSEQSNFIESLARERGINDFLTANKEKYPDLSADDLTHVDDPRDLETEAARVQRRLEDHAQAKLLEIENSATPRITPEQLAEIEAQAEKNPSADSMSRVIAARMQR